MLNEIGIEEIRLSGIKDAAEQLRGRFPRTATFTGINTPQRIEADIVDLQVDGVLPPQVEGILYRCGPDPAYPPIAGDDIYVNGDGMVSMYVLAEGRASMRTRYVRTDKFNAEREAGHALFGLYRNPYTDHPSMQGVDRTTANTSMIWHANRLFAIKEDGLAHELDPLTLRTMGKQDFDGRLRSKTMTAHPKMDPVTGEWVFYGYSAAGELSDDIAVAVADADGRLTDEQWLLPPYQSVIHDWAVSQQHAVLPVMPLTTDPERVRAGGPRWAWDPEQTTHLGVLKRNASVDDMVWFDGPARWSFHTLNSFSEGSLVHVDLCVSQAAPWTHKNGDPFDPGLVTQYLTRWTCDLSKRGGEFQEVRLLDGIGVDFPEIDQRYATKAYRHGFLTGKDRDKPVDPLISRGVWFNTLIHIDVQTGETERWYVGDGGNIQEPVFIPRSDDAPEGDGFLVALVNRLPFAHTELIVIDTARFADGPVATVHIPLHIRPTFHGLWVSVEELGYVPHIRPE
ncbi:carotenoid oxygenase family protein [Microbacterium album]|uniref:Dioxygenase n=1 Tax=Microbacterium album TaxID=2053191 RepID=A0A917ID85_9MICO|nr:carotenoid oxygenase family protein [Microbacterium album]GGH36961.1 carotenoid oxygenase [Microbacterium album]